MGILRGVVTQSGADTFTQVAINTDLTSDGKTGWLFNNFEVFWSNGGTTAVADSNAYGILSTQATTVTLFTDPEEICRVGWQVVNQAGVAVAFEQEPIKMRVAAPDRITVQPILYLSVSSSATGQANVMYFQAQYEEVKLSDIEVLRLLVGGA